MGMKKKWLDELRKVEKVDEKVRRVDEGNLIECMNELLC